jgi:hypothetical protein
MKTLVFHYQEIKEGLKSQLETAQTTEQVVQLLQDRINQLADLNGDYIRGLTPQQARLATILLRVFNHYTNILSLVNLQNSSSNTLEQSSNNTNLQQENESGLTNFTADTLSPLTKFFQIDKHLSTLTSPDYYKQALRQQVQQNHGVISGVITGALSGLCAGGYSWGFIGAIAGGVIGKIVQPKQSLENTNLTSLPEPHKNEFKIGVDIDRLLIHLYQAFQSIDITVAAYGEREEKAISPGLENNLDLLEYLQELMADALDEQTQLPITVRRRIEQAATILRHYGIQAQTYQPTAGQSQKAEALSIFYFEPSLDPEVTNYITLKPALVKDDQLLLPGYVIEPASSGDD